MAFVGLIALPIAVAAAVHEANVQRWENKGPLGHLYSAGYYCGSRGCCGRGCGGRYCGSSGCGYQARARPAALLLQSPAPPTSSAPSLKTLYASIESISGPTPSSSWRKHHGVLRNQRTLARRAPFVVLQLGQQFQSTARLSSLPQAASWSDPTLPFLVGQQLSFPLPAAGTSTQLQVFVYGNSEYELRLKATASVSIDSLLTTGQSLSVDLPMFDRHGRNRGVITLALHLLPTEASEVVLNTPTLYGATPPANQLTLPSAPKIPPPTIVVMSADGEPSIGVPEEGNGQDEKAAGVVDYPNLL